MRNTVSMCFAANNILLMRNCNQSLCEKWQIAFLSCQRASDLHMENKTTTELGYSKI